MQQREWTVRDLGEAIEVRSEREFMTVCVLKCDAEPASIDHLEALGDARLISASPKLLAACKGLVNLLDAHGWGEGPDLRYARAAIKEAS